MTDQLSIILVDDDRIDLFIHAETIKSLPFVTSVLQFPLAGTALNYLETHDAAQWPDVLLLDIHMPVMNGFDFLLKYSELPLLSRKKCKVILLSSSLNSEDHKKAENSSDVFGFIGKPLNIAKLQELILKKIP